MTEEKKQDVLEEEALEEEETTLFETEADQVSGGYYPQMWSEKKDKAQERVYQ